MKIEIKTTKEIDITLAECEIFARYFEDSELNGVEDDATNPKMPCVEMRKNYANRDQLAWCPVIDINRGKILNWKKGEKAYIHYKSCDENYIKIYDCDNNLVADYDGYVPNFLTPSEHGYGDYVIMHIDEDGNIEDFKPVFDDIDFKL